MNLEINKNNNYEPFKDGVSINIATDESINSIDSGIVVFMGEKEGYGNTLIIQQSNGVDVWYGNMETFNVNLYDYVSKGLSLGTSSNNLYLVFQKNEEFLDYKEFIK